MRQNAIAPQLGSLTLSAAMTDSHRFPSVMACFSTRPGGQE